MKYAITNLFLFFLEELVIISSRSNRVKILKLIYFLYATA